MPRIHAAVIGTILGFCWCGIANAQQITIKIGLVGATTGPGSGIGTDSENGATMAAEELNVQAISINGQIVHFALLTQNDRGDPKTAADVAQKLVDANAKAVVGHSTPSTTAAASRIYDQAGIAQIAAAPAGAAYSKQGFTKAFSIVATNKILASSVANYVSRFEHIKKVAIIDDGTTDGADISAEFSKINSSSVEVVYSIHLPKGLTDYHGYISKVRASNPDLIFIATNDSTAGNLINQSLGDNFRPEFAAGPSVCTSNFLKTTAAAQGVKMTCVAPSGTVSDLHQLNTSWTSAYKKRFGMATQGYGQYAYDAVMIVADAMVRSKSTEPAVYSKYLPRLHHAGVTGQIEFGPDGANKNSKTMIFTIKGGRYSFLQEFGG